MGYRPDIEGLRGLAVILVVLAHAGVPWAWGGFVGVDVFFVISGYLITGLLMDELRAQGRVDLWTFFARRVRRLLPALSAMFVGTGAIAIMLLARDEWHQHARDALWGALWVGNIGQAHAELDYFAPARESSLYLHLWSLGVEEQFYLVWPLLLGLAWRIGRLRGGLTLLMALAFLGYFAMLAHAAESALAAYYLPTARAWQFAAGGSVWWIARTFPMGKVTSIAARSLGLLLICAATLGIDENVRYPGGAALAPTSGTALALIAGASHASGSWLQARLLTAVGRWSYGWYLWHWPLVVLAGILAPGSITAVLLSVVLSLLLAWTSFRFLESPIRSRPVRSPRTWVALGVGASLCLALAAGVWKAHSPDPAAPEQAGVNRHALRVAVQLPELYARGCIQGYRDSEARSCRFPGGMMPRGVVVLLGDSVMAQWEPALRPVFRDARIELVVFLKSACAPIGEPYRLDVLGGSYVSCLEWTDSAMRQIEELKPDAVLLSMASSYSMDPEAWARGTAHTLAKLSRSGASTVILMPTPVLPGDPVTCLARINRGLPTVTTSDDCVTDLVSARLQPADAAIRNGHGGMPGAALLPTAEIACPDGVCRAWQDGRLVWRDQTHLDAGYVSAQRAALRLALREALGRAGRPDLLPQ